MIIEPYHEKVEEYVEQHSHFDDEPLVLAVRYLPNGTDDNIYLLEVAENVGLNMPDPDRQICAVDWLSSPSFPINNGGLLHLAITNPVELETALAEDWPDIKPIAESVRTGKYEIVYQRDEVEAARLLNLLSYGIAA